MRQKKIEEQEEAEEVAEKEQPKDIKLAEFQLKESAVLLIKKTNYKGEDRIDFRVWLNSPTYKGPTKQGFVLTMNKIDAFIEAVNKIKEKLKDSK
jgi:hypothetical protein